MDAEVINDKDLQSLPTKEEIEKNIDHEKLKKLLLYISHRLKLMAETGVSSINIPPTILSVLGYKSSDHENTVREFFTEKGYTVTVDNKGVFTFK